VDDQVRRLIFFVLGTRMIKISEFVEGELAVAFGSADDLRLRPTVGGRRLSCFMR